MPLHATLSPVSLQHRPPWGILRPMLDERYGSETRRSYWRCYRGQHPYPRVFVDPPPQTRKTTTQTLSLWRWLRPRRYVAEHKSLETSLPGCLPTLPGGRQSACKQPNGAGLRETPRGTTASKKAVSSADLRSTTSTQRPGKEPGNVWQPALRATCPNSRGSNPALGGL